MFTFKSLLKLSSAILLTSQLVSLNTWAQRQESNKLGFETVINISDYKGSTFFSLMESRVKPALDKYSEHGVQIRDGNQVKKLLQQVDRKVSRNAVSAAGDIYQLQNVADKLSATDKKINFYELPEAISKAGASRGRFDLATFYSLVSGGGVAVKIDENNITYNVNYGSGKVAKDEMTGRSFGESFGRLALDASDKHYLEMLEKYVRSADENVKYFYQSIFEILTNNDTSSFSKINTLGQAVATDFIAVYIAEQDRHLMANLKSHHWDKALLEVTLLSALHAGQTDIMLMMDGKMTKKSFKQMPGCSTEAKVAKKASLIDYWQFSKSTDPSSCKRSGLNITRNDFTKLGRVISNFERKNNPKLYNKVARHFKNIRASGNLFADLSTLLISYKTPEKLDKQTLELAQDFTELLMQVRADADAISGLKKPAQSDYGTEY